MPTPIQSLGISQALAESLGIKGRLSVSLDEVLVPVAVALDLSVSPYATIDRPVVGGNEQAAGALNYGFVGVQAAPDVILVIDRIVIANIQGAAQRVDLRWLQTASVASLTDTLARHMKDANSPQRPSGIPNLASQVIASTKVAPVTGALWGQVSLPVSDTIEIGLGPRGFALYGNDPEGLSRLCVVSNVVNEAIAATFVGREFRLPG